MCTLQDPIKKRMKKSSLVPGYPALSDVHNIAHVFPCGQIKYNVRVAVENWSCPRKHFLKEFVEWLFKIDKDARIQEVFLTGNANNVVTFEGTTLYNRLMGIARNLLETIVIV